MAECRFCGQGEAEAKKWPPSFTEFACGTVYNQTSGEWIQKCRDAEREFLRAEVKRLAARVAELELSGGSPDLTALQEEVRQLREDLDSTGYFGRAEE